jgi:serine protease Do
MEKKYDLNTNIKSYKGVLLESIERDGPASKAGLKPGDIILQVDGKPVNSQSEFEEIISYHYPGDKMNLTFTHDDKTINTGVTLFNENGDTGMIQRKIFSSPTLGAQLEGSEYGVKVSRIEDGGYFKKLGMPENYTIISINRVRVSDPAEVIDFFGKYKGKVSIYGITASKEVLPFNFVLR